MSKPKRQANLWLSVLTLIVLVYLAVNALMNYSENGYTLIRTTDLVFITFIAILNVVVEDIWPKINKSPKGEPSD